MAGLDLNWAIVDDEGKPTAYFEDAWNSIEFNLSGGLSDQVAANTLAIETNEGNISSNATAIGVNADAIAALDVDDINNFLEQIRVGSYWDGYEVTTSAIWTFGTILGDGSVPTAGTTGQGLVKSTATDYDYAWSDSTITSLSTGILDGGELSINVDTTKFDIADGAGLVVDNADPLNPVFAEVSWTGLTAQTVTDILTEISTNIAIDSAGAVIQQAAPFTEEQKRDYILLGGLTHVDNVNVDSAFESTIPAYDVGVSVNSLADAIGPLNLTGNLFTANGANLSLDKSAGTVFSYGDNHDNNVKDPHTTTQIAQTLANFFRIYDDGTGAATFVFTTTVDPDNKDDGSGTLAAVANNKFTIQKIWMYPNTGLSLVQYGTVEYANIPDAKAGTIAEAFPFFPALATAIVRAYLIVKKGTTDLTVVTDTLFVEADKFQSASPAASGISNIVEDLTPQLGGNLDPNSFGVSANWNPDLTSTQSLGGSTLTWLEAHVDHVHADQITLEYTALADNETSSSITLDAAGFSGVRATDVTYDTGAIGAGAVNAVYFTTIDRSDSTGGRMTGYAVSTTDAGSAEVFGYVAGVGVKPVGQLSGVVGDMDSALVLAVDQLSNLTTAGPTVSVFVVNSDTVTLGNATQFTSMRWDLPTPSSKDLTPIFEHSTGIGTWSTFTPLDGTNGFTASGNIAWFLSGLTGWATGTGGEYLIRITRDRTGVVTTPIADTISISTAVEYTWNEDGDLEVNSITMNTDLAIADGGTGASTAAGARTNLNVDIAGTDNSTNVTLAGAPDYLTIAGQVITMELVNLEDHVDGVLQLFDGGTGDAAVTSANIGHLKAMNQDVATTSVTRFSRLGLGVNAHASTPLNITHASQHIRLNNGTELGLLTLDTLGCVNVWSHGPNETIMLYSTGSGTQAARFGAVNTFISPVKVDNTTDATSLTAASVQTDGGISAVKSIQLGGHLVVPKASTAGIKVDNTAPTFGFADLLGDQFSRNTGATKPTLATYNGDIRAWQFGAGKEAYLSFHIPHDYVLGTEIFCHIHWSHDSTTVTGGTLTFKVSSVYAKGHGQAAFQSTPAVGTFTGTASTTQYMHIISETSYSSSTPTGLQLDTDLLEPDGVIEMTFKMDVNNITSSAAVPNPFIHYVDIHYQTTGLIGTKDKVPDFYT